MTDLFDSIETYGATCWVPLCEWESPERFSGHESIRDYREHMAQHRATNQENGSKP